MSHKLGNPNTLHPLTAVPNGEAEIQPAPQASEDAMTDWVTDEGDILNDELTPEELAAQERLNTRRDAVTRQISAYYDGRTVTPAHIPRSIKQRTSDPEEQIKLFKPMHESDVLRLAVDIASSNWSDNALPAFTHDVIRIADILEPNERNPRLAWGLVGALETADDVALAQEQAVKWHARVMQGASKEDQVLRAEHFKNVITNLSGTGYPRQQLPTELKASIFDEMLDTYAVTYDYETAYPNNPKAATFVKTARTTTLDNAMKWEDAGQATHLNTLLQAATKEDPALAERFFELARCYGINHALDPLTTDTLIANVLPRMRLQDPALRPLLEYSNSFGWVKGEFGIADFYVHSLTREATPGTVNELLMALREIPASTQERLESNRADALRLASTFGILRDFIHDERPGVNQVLGAMIHYAKTGDAAALNTAMDKTDYFQAGSAYRHLLLDLTNYAQEIKPRGSSPAEPAMAIIERLEKNTRPVDEEPPVVTDQALGELLAAAYAAKPWEKKQAVASATWYVNDQLTAMMDKGAVGIEPSMITAIAWVDREQFKILQGLTFEDQIRLPRQPWFKDTLKLHELTHNEAYDAEEFESFMHGIEHMSDQDAFRAIAKRVLQQTQHLAEKYKARGKHLWAEALWSGNTTHELIGLIDPRKAATAVGRRLVAEAYKQ